MSDSKIALIDETEAQLGLRDFANNGNDYPLDQYFKRIQLPHYYWRTRHDLEQGDTENPNERLDYLRTLIRHHVRSIPFENVSLHYSWHRVIHVDPRHVFEKLVKQERGGYCMEQNTLLNGILRALGYDAYLAGARVYNPATDKFGGYDHCVNIVSIGDRRYLADVGFGSGVPVFPIRMNPERQTIHAWAMTEMRVRRGTIPQGNKRDAEYWIYEHRPGGLGGWTPLYCFTEGEFLPEDIEIANLKPSTTPTSIFVQKLIVVRFTTNQDAYPDKGVLRVNRRPVVEVPELHGKLIVDGDMLRLRWDREVVFEERFESEEQRVRVLDEYFGIKLSEVERAAIQGTLTEVKPPIKAT
ncbi:hypothetical protein ACJ41O_003467 [Fusarium nematophilum]